jgi:hypothetical protein
VKLSHLTLVACLLPGVLGAQSTDSLDQRGRTLVALGLGLTGSHDATIDASKISARGKGQVASLSIMHFVGSAVAVEVSGAVLDENNYVAGTRAHHESVAPLLFGVNWSPASLAITSALRPFVSFATGPYIHSVADAGVGRESASTEMVLGGRVGAGANWYVSRHFALQVEGDYHAVPDFEVVDGIRQNVSGLSLSVGLGFAWGGVRHPR